MNDLKTLRLASAGTPTALARAARVGHLLETRLDPLTVVNVVVTGPLDPAKQTERLVEKLRSGEVDLAVQSATRLPDPLPNGIRLAALIRDRDPRYRCVTTGRPCLDALPPGISLITCDPLARAQLLHRLPRARVTLVPPSWEILAGLRHAAWDAACLPPSVLDIGSLAGLRSEPIPEEVMLPAVGQGKSVLLVAAESGAVRERLVPLEDPELEICFEAEVSFLAQVTRTAEEPGVLASARAVLESGMLTLTGLMAQEEGRWLVMARGEASPASARIAALQAADSCTTLARQRQGHSPSPAVVAP